MTIEELARTAKHWMQENPEERGLVMLGVDGDTQAVAIYGNSDCVNTILANTVYIRRYASFSESLDEAAKLAERLSRGEEPTKGGEL